MDAQQLYRIVATDQGADVFGRISPEAARAVQEALTVLARARDDAAARGQRHAHVRGYCARFRLTSSPSGPTLEVSYLSPRCEAGYGTPELMLAI